MKKNWLILIIIFVGLLVVNFIASNFYIRFDLTEDKRYTLSEAAKNTLKDVDSPVFIEVFLKGEFPSEFVRLKAETRQILEEFKAENTNVVFEFIDPFENEANPEEIKKQLFSLGIIPAQAQVRENGKTSQVFVYPWALAYYNNKTVRIPLLKNQLGTTSEERVNNSVQNLEYAFADGFNKLVSPKKRKVAVLKGNGELQDGELADFIKTLKEYYFTAAFTLDSAVTSPTKVIKQIKDFDLLVIAKPTEAFSDTEKYILDQYTMNGGKSLWLIDAVTMDSDSLFNTGNTLAIPRDLRLTDFFFKYGIRINKNLVNDLYSAPIVLASGAGNNTQYEKYHWFYNPLSASTNSHPIVDNIEAVKFEYASDIDTLSNSIKKTVLLSSSKITKLVGTPSEIKLDYINTFSAIVNEGPNPQEYASGERPMAVLLEGTFTSVYNNRVKPFIYSEDKSESVDTKMVVISDGDVIKNQFQGNRPLELGFDKWTNTFYGNKEFLLNTVNYLLDDTGLINIRSKEISVAFLDPQKTANERTKWQLLNVLVPLLLLGVFGFLFKYVRKRRFAQ